MACTLDEQLMELMTLEKPALRDRWVKLTGQSAPRFSPAMLRLGIGYESQSKALGVLSRKATRRLAEHASDKHITRDVQPGMRLAREYAGKVHVVTIGDEGEIAWNDRTWNSLGEVARAITGTRWSGPAFFGLRRKAGAP